MIRERYVQYNNQESVVIFDVRDLKKMDKVGRKQLTQKVHLALVNIRIDWKEKDAMIVDAMIIFLCVDKFIICFII